MTVLVSSGIEQSWSRRYGGNNETSMVGGKILYAATPRPRREVLALSYELRATGTRW